MNTFATGFLLGVMVMIPVVLLVDWTGRGQMALLRARIRQLESAMDTQPGMAKYMAGYRLRWK